MGISKGLVLPQHCPTPSISGDIEPLFNIAKANGTSILTEMLIMRRNSLCRDSRLSFDGVSPNLLTVAVCLFMFRR